MSNPLHIKVLKAVGLKAADTFGTSDPFFKAELIVNGKRDKKQKYKSSVIKNTVNPVWNEVFVFNLNSGMEDVTTIRIQILDWDRLSSSDTLGWVRIPASKLTSGEPVSLKFNVEGKKPGTLGMGKLFIMAHYCPVGVPFRSSKSNKSNTSAQTTTPAPAATGNMGGWGAVMNTVNPGQPMNMSGWGMVNQGVRGMTPGWGTMNQGMMNQGMMNQGMMNQGMMNPGMMNQGMMNPGMNQGMMNQGMMNNNMGMPNGSGMGGTGTGWGFVGNNMGAPQNPGMNQGWGAMNNNMGGGMNQGWGMNNGRR